MSIDAQRFFKAIQNLASQEVKAARQDKTIIAEIVAIENADVGKYRVKYQGNTFFAIATNATILYKVGEQVYVLVPQGDFSAQKVILGYSSYQSITEQEDVLTNFYINVGPNWIADNGWYDYTEKNLGIVATALADKDQIVHGDANWEDVGFILEPPSSQDPKTRYSSHGMSPAELEQAMFEVSSLSKSCEFIKVSGEFKTNFIKTHNKGTYGLRVDLLVSSKNTDVNSQSSFTFNGKTYERKTLELGFPVFTGAPYNYTEYTRQTAYFPVLKGSIEGLVQVSLQQDGNLETDRTRKLENNIVVDDDPINASNNIFVRNLEICFAQKVNLADTPYYAYISTPKGVNLYGHETFSTTFGVEEVELRPHLLYKGHDIFNSKNCEALWFRQKADITLADVGEADKDEHNKTWFDYGGNGWYPIQKFLDNRDACAGTYLNNEWEPYYLINNGVLKIRKDAVKFKWRYKLVIIYRDSSNNNYDVKIFPVDPITITRADSQYDLDLEKYIEGVLKTFLRIRDYKKDPYGTETQEDGQAWREWFGTYWLERVDGSYERVSSPYHPNGSGQYPFDITRWMAQPIARFHVQCYDPYEVDPQNTGVATVQVDEVTDLTLECVNVDNPELLVTWEGRDAFYYDALGSVKNWTVSQDNILKPTLKWLTDSVDAYTIEIRGPGNGLLSTRIYSESDEDYYVEPGSENTYDFSGSMMTGMYIDQDYCIHFKVREKYDESKNDNTYRLIIRMSGRTEPFEISKEILFVKDGDQGTIGSDWSAPIYPCNFGTTKDNETAYVEKLDSQQTVPLVIHMNTEEWQQNDNFRLALRPFVSKNGVKIENMDPYEGYFYRCYWDVRMPNSITNALAKNASFLRLYHVTDGSMSSDSPIIFDNVSTGSSAWNMGRISGTTETNPNEGEPNGLVALTGWPASQQEYAYTDDTENYGAVEVRFFDNRCPGRTVSVNNVDTVKYVNEDDNTLLYKGTGASLEDMMYRFVVKCQVEVIKGQYDAAAGKIQTNGETRRVASITSFYPVDIVFTSQSKTDFNNKWKSSSSPLYGFAKRMQLNWPQYVQYNATGYDPATIQGADGLYLVVGDKDPSNLKSYLAENLTPLIQEVETRVDSDGKIKQVYKPSTHLNMTEGFCGALRTIPGQGFFDDNDSFFVRNQIMYLNSYGNIDINGWDGQGIDMNEDDGTIFAATLGAGFKEPTTNLFTGVLMGVDRSQPRANYDNNGTYDREYLESHPYMAGLFGYQDGVSSFGIMENGTGFFGRADRGGRIIFDGSNATMYGGGNGFLGSPKIGDSMWNTMRLSFVDLTHPTSKNYTSIKGAHGQLINQGFDGAYFKDSMTDDKTNANSMPKWYRKLWENAYIKPNGALPFWLTKESNQSIEAAYLNLKPYTGTLSGNKNFQINYYHPESGNNGSWFEQPDLETIRSEFETAKAAYEKDPDGYYTNNTKSKKAIYLEKLQALLKNEQLTGFGANRASTTPAIEIGQHVPGLMPGIFEWDDYKTIFKELRIPGDRNFMVTYDGTMWAMNGIFMGVIVGSNIIGGRIQGAEIGVGERTTNTNKTVYLIDTLSNCDYSLMTPPVENEAVTAASLLSAKGGGEKLGLYVAPDGDVIANNIAIYGGRIDVGHFHIIGRRTNSGLEEGHLIQAAHSDFIGETHCYGGLAVAPATTSSSGKYHGSNYGNLFQTSGKVALGILPEKHENFVNRFWSKASSSGYVGSKGSGLEGNAYEQGAIFGIDTSNETNGQYQGHFWPLAFRFNNKNRTSVRLSYATTMNIFANQGTSDVLGLQYPYTRDGGNYFRIGPWGSEGSFHFIRKNFQLETDCEEPNPTNYLGWLGIVDRAGEGGNTTIGSPAIGITSWGQSPIILKATDGNVAIRAAGNINFSSSTSDAYNNNSEYNYGFQLGTSTGTVASKPNRIYGAVPDNGYISLAVWNKPTLTSSDINANVSNGSSECVCGISLTSDGINLWTRDTDDTQKCGISLSPSGGISIWKTTGGETKSVQWA